MDSPRHQDSPRQKKPRNRSREFRATQEQRGRYPLANHISAVDTEKARAIGEKERDNALQHITTVQKAHEAQIT
ncbi:hypothetical protein FDECE_7378 [Fusarium decemcellulare]|nr:hypothetical protein FDECE_7378 [Fusarium decemcellulare]